MVLFKQNWVRRPATMNRYDCVVWFTCYHFLHRRFKMTNLPILTKEILHSVPGNRYVIEQGINIRLRTFFLLRRPQTIQHLLKRDHVCHNSQFGNFQNLCDASEHPAQPGNSYDHLVPRSDRTRKKEATREMQTRG